MPVSDNQNDCALKLSVNTMHFESEVNGFYAAKCSNDKRVRDCEMINQIHPFSHYVFQLNVLPF